VEKQKVQIIVPANLKYSSFVRHIASDIFNIAKFCNEWGSRLKLVVDELFMNAVKYGSTTDKSFVYITFFYDGSEIQLVIEDDGTGPGAVPAEKLEEILRQNEKNTDLSRTSGRGLSMITEVWTDEMIISESKYGGISVAVKKKVEIAPPDIQPVQPAGFVKQANPKKTPETESAEHPFTNDVTPPSASAEPRVYEIKLSGEIDQTNIDEIVTPINDQAHTMPAGSILSLDFADVKYINSMFIGNLAECYKLLHSKGGSVRLKNMSKEIEEVLGLVGILEVLQGNK
jgi:anti-anti-sigma factor